MRALVIEDDANSHTGHVAALYDVGGKLVELRQRGFNLASRQFGGFCVRRRAKGSQDEGDHEK